MAQGTIPPRPPLPSDAEPGHMYGMPPGHRAAEVVRWKGNFEPPVKHLVQGAYVHDFIKTNAKRGMASTGWRDYNSDDKFAQRPPVATEHLARFGRPAKTTRATMGHTLGAQNKLHPPPPGPKHDNWKMSKFVKTQPRVTAYMGGPTLYATQPADVAPVSDATEQ